MWGNYSIPQNLQPKIQLTQSNPLQPQIMQRPYPPNQQFTNPNSNIYQPNYNQQNLIQQQQNLFVQPNQVNYMNQMPPNTNPAMKQPQQQPHTQKPPLYQNNQINAPTETGLQQTNKPLDLGKEVQQNIRNGPETQVNMNLYAQKGYSQPPQLNKQYIQGPIPTQIIQNQQKFKKSNAGTNAQFRQRPQQTKTVEQPSTSRAVTSIKQIHQGNKIELDPKSRTLINVPNQSNTFIPSAVDQLLGSELNDEDYFEYILMYGYRSRKGLQSGNPDKINQDSIVISTNINEQTSQHYFGVCDGHGPAGHQVSGFLKQNFPPLLNQINPKQSIPNQLLKVYYKLGEKLGTEAKFDLNFSGSTSVGCLLNHNKLFCANLGDSRAVLGKFSNGKWIAQELSQDQKATNPIQRQRIQNAGGQIEPIKDSSGKALGVDRVWLKGKNFPGLAMSRSFGDLVAASVGVINVPEIKQFTLTNQDKILVVGSDGLWQFLSSQNVIDIVFPYYEKKQFQQACSRLLQFALNLWNNNHPDTIDDISFVVAFLDYEVQDEF